VNLDRDISKSSNLHATLLS